MTNPVDGRECEQHDNEFIDIGLTSVLEQRDDSMRKFSIGNETLQCLNREVLQHVLNHVIGMMERTSGVMAKYLHYQFRRDHIHNESIDCTSNIVLTMTAHRFCKKDKQASVGSSGVSNIHVLKRHITRYT